MRYTYCPDCGRELVPRPAGDEGDVPFCTNCERYWFDSFACASIVLIANEFNELVLLRQSYLSDTYCTFVSGYITPGETAEETAWREVAEEVGITLDSLEYVTTVWFDKKEILMHGFIGRVKKCDFTLSVEVDDAAWVPYEEVPDKLFPERPGNAAFVLYRTFCKQLEDGTK